MSLPNTSFHSDSNFESAVQDLEQEKKMVAALKRLSIGHMMQYDPDLPPGSMDDIDPFANNNNNSNTASNNNHYNGHTRDHTSNNNNTHNHSPNSKLNHHRGQSPYDEDLIPQNIHRSHSTRSRSKSHSTSPSTSPQHKPQQQQQPQPFPHEPQTPPYNKSPSPVKRRSFYDNSSVLTSESHDIFFDAEDEVYDSSSPLLWVPANSHPQVNPESFKSLIKTQVEEILERKLSRKSTISRKSTLSRSSSTSTKETLAPEPEISPELECDVSPPSPVRKSSLSSSSQQNQNEDVSRKSSSSVSSTSPQKDPAKRESWYFNNSKRYLNPSLRELTSELEQLSKMAGMDKNDAVTLARTLSAQSLGYTDVEKLAFDELDSSQTTATATTPNSLGSPGSYDSANPPRTTTLHLQQRLQHQFQQAQIKAEREAERSTRHQQSEQQWPVSNDDSHKSLSQLSASEGGSNANAFTSAGSGADFALKRSRRTDYRKKETDSKQKTSNNSPPTRKYNVRNSQLLFNYKKPVDSPSLSPSPSPSTSQSMMGHRVKHKKSQKSLEAALANPMMDGSDMSHNPYPTASTTIDFSRMGAKKSARQSLSPENAMDGRSRTKPENKTHRGYLHQERSHPYHQQPQPQVQPQTRQQLPPAQQAHRQSTRQTHNHPSTGVEKHHRQDNKRVMLSASNTDINDFMVQLNQFQTNGTRNHRYDNLHKKDKTAFLPNEDHQRKSHSTRNSNVRNLSSSSQQHLHQPYLTTSVAPKSRQLHQNLDKLRSEINEFKESLNKSELPGEESKREHRLRHDQHHQQRQRPAPSQHQLEPRNYNHNDRHQRQQHEHVQPQQVQPLQSDTSFDISYQDLSVEDQLGIEQEALRELGKEKGHSHEIDIDDAFDEDLEVLPINDGHGSQFTLDHDILDSFNLVDNQLVGSADEGIDNLKGKNEIPVGRQQPQQQRQQPRAASPPSSQQYLGHDELHLQQGKDTNKKVGPRLSIDTLQNKPIHPEETATGFGMNALPSPTLHLDESQNSTPGHLRKASNSASYDDYYNIADKSSTAGTPKTKKETKVKTKLFNKDPNLEIIDSDNYKEKMGIETSNNKKLKKKKSFGLLSTTSSVGANDTSENEGPKKLKKKKSWGWLRERSASASSADINNLPPLPLDKLPTRSFSNPETSTDQHQKHDLENGSDLERELEHEPELELELELDLEFDYEQQRKHQDASMVNDSSFAVDSISMKSTDKENVLSKFFKKKAKVPGSSSQSVFSFESKGSGASVDYESDNDAKLIKKKGNNSSRLFKKKSRAKLSEQENSVNKEKLRPLNLVSNESQTIEEKENLRQSNGTRKAERVESQEQQEEQFPVTSSPIHQFNIEHLKDDFVTLGEKDDVLDSGTDDLVEDVRSRNIQSTIVIVDEDETPIQNNNDNKDLGMLKVDELSKKKSISRKKRNNMQKKNLSTELTDTNKEVVEEVLATEQSVKPSQGEDLLSKNEDKEKLDIQEKLKKSIKRTSRANQPIEFTDSAFGFPLPPPSQSTLVMLDYRFPVHVERAIYRLSHLKLANPKRSLREQVLLSNFMYAYLNLVDHTLHLEQQNMSSEDGDQMERDDDEEEEMTDTDEKDMIFGESNIADDDDLIPEEANGDSIGINLDMDGLHRKQHHQSGIEV